MTRGRRVRRAGGTVALVALAGCAVVATPAAAEPVGFTPEHAQRQLRDEEAFKRGVDPASLGALSAALSAEPSVVASPANDARIRTALDRLRGWGLQPQEPTYDSYLSVPRRIRVTQTAPRRRALRTRENDAPAGLIVGYNAYSPAGDVTGEVVYANYGLPDDYDELRKRRVSVRGKIVLVRYGESFRGVKAKVAQDAGARGIIIYSDPADDGYKQGRVYPRGPWRPADGIQRGSIQYLFQYPGDPLTPGRASTPDAPRLRPSQAENLPRIPSVPMSYGQAVKLLRGLDGPRAPKAMRGGLPVPYRLGPGGTRVRLDLDIDYTRAPIRDVIVEFPGARRPEQKVIVGAHLDTWGFGTHDDTSGWAAVLEIGRVLSELQRRGWRPDRTIVLAGWDGEEYGLLGSTEWVEANRPALAAGAVGYINMDGVGGRTYEPATVPAVDDFVSATARDVPYAASSRSLYDAWKAQNDDKPEYTRLGSGSDYTAFLDHVGVPSMDIGLSAKGYPGVYHSAYDNLDWMRRFGDPGYDYHATAARMSGLLALRLASSDVLPLRYAPYAEAVAGYVRGLRAAQRKQYRRQRVDLRPLLGAAGRWEAAAARLSAAGDALLADGADPARRDAVNAALIRQERLLLDERGLPGRSWYKHQVYVPGLLTGYASQPLASIEDALAAGRFALARRQAARLVASLDTAAREAGVAAG